jgi:hypothetical protein
LLWVVCLAVHQGGPVEFKQSVVGSLPTDCEDHKHLDWIHTGQLESALGLVPIRWRQRNQLELWGRRLWSLVSIGANVRSPVCTMCVPHILLRLSWMWRQPAPSTPVCSRRNSGDSENRVAMYSLYSGGLVDAGGSLTGGSLCQFNWLCPPGHACPLSGPGAGMYKVGHLSGNASSLGVYFVCTVMPPSLTSCRSGCVEPPLSKHHR